jgi:hypothetical protein
MGVAPFLERMCWAFLSAAGRRLSRMGRRPVPLYDMYR